MSIYKQADKIVWEIRLCEGVNALELVDSDGKVFGASVHISRKGERALSALAFEHGATHVTCAYDGKLTDE